MDFATLVTEGMKLIGRSDLVADVAAIDNHSTITLSLSDQQVVHLTTMDELPVIWAPLPAELPALHAEVKGELLDALTAQTTSLFYPGLPAIRQTDDGTELVACFSESAVSDSETFIQALDQFVRVYQQCHALLLRA
ncbi:Type III secretion system protein BsaR [Morganella psychrotolerans]|uniref:Type III secretion system protein BsaR n=1 Tax=Morganella psychrotolerans TaxID=368603 RepID=UPI0039B06A98